MSDNLVCYLLRLDSSKTQEWQVTNQSRKQLIEDSQALNTPKGNHDTIKQTEHKQLFAVDFIQSKKETQGDPSGSHTAEENVVSGAVESCNVVLCCNKALWELVEKQLPPEDRYAKTMGLAFADHRNPIDHFKNYAIHSKNDFKIICGSFFCALEVAFPLII